MAQSGETGSARAMEIWLLPFAAMFTQPSWLNAVALATGALLCLNRRTVCGALRAVDGASDKGFSRFHRFLSRGAWSGLTGSRILLGLLLKAVVADGQPMVIAVDDTIERRGASRSAPKGATVIRCGRATGSSSRSRACGGCRSSWRLGPVLPNVLGNYRS
jgi:hypothetical protein